MLDITVKIPEERLAEFYAMYGQWLAAPPGEPVPGADDAEPQDWSAGDAEIAKKVWDKFSPRAKKMFSTLIDNPNQHYSGETLAGLHKIPNGRHGVAGVLAWPSRHCFNAGRQWCWRWDYPEDEEGAVYWMDSLLAELFKKARG